MLNYKDKYLVHATKKAIHRHHASYGWRQIHSDAITAPRDVRKPLGPLLERDVFRLGVDAYVVVVSVLKCWARGPGSKVHIDVLPV